MEYIISHNPLKHRALKKNIGFCILSGVLLLSIIVPPFHEGRVTVCLFKNIFGIPSPGCGMTRAFLYLGHGDIYEAISLNPNSLLAFSIVIILWLNEIIKMIRKKEVNVQLTKREKFLIYFVSAGLMIAGWFYNLFLNPYV